MQAAAAILVVHARLDARIHARKPGLPLERPTAAFLAQGVTLLAALTLAVRQEWWLAAALGIPGLLNSLELARLGDSRALETPLKTVGMRAMALSVLANGLLIVGMWQRTSACGTG